MSPDAAFTAATFSCSLWIILHSALKLITGKCSARLRSCDWLGIWSISNFFVVCFGSWAVFSFSTLFSFHYSGTFILVSSVQRIIFRTAQAFLDFLDVLLDVLFLRRTGGFIFTFTLRECKYKRTCQIPSIFTLTKEFLDCRPWQWYPLKSVFNLVRCCEAVFLNCEKNSPVMYFVFCCLSGFLVLLRRPLHSLFWRMAPPKIVLSQR